MRKRYDGKEENRAAKKPKGRERRRMGEKTKKIKKRDDERNEYTKRREEENKTRMMIEVGKAVSRSQQQIFPPRALPAKK